MRDYESLESLYNYIKHMSDEQYMSYLNNIENFLKSDLGYKFNSKYVADVIVKNINKDIRE